jgi:hypothetical protein
MSIINKVIEELTNIREKINEIELGTNLKRRRRIG